MSLRLFVDAALAAGAEFDLPEGAARHAQVRRVQPGDALRLFDGRGGEWEASVVAMGRSRVAVRVGLHHEVSRELTRPITLAVGMPANERMDWLVEKATELGVACVQPLLCERSVLRLAGERAQKKREHWQAVAVAAAEQSGRTRVPQVQAVATLHDFLGHPDAPAERWLLGPTARQRAVLPADGRPLVVLSGPEGGLTPQEEDAAAAAGFVAVNLGPRVLRAETAPLAVMAWCALAG